MANRRIFAMIQKAETIRQSRIEKNTQFTFTLLNGETVSTDVNGAIAFVHSGNKFISCTTKSRSHGVLADIFSGLGESDL